MAPEKNPVLFLLFFLSFIGSIRTRVVCNQTLLTFTSISQSPVTDFFVAPPGLACVGTRPYTQTGGTYGTIQT
jgi:hypothetical protein